MATSMHDQSDKEPSAQLLRLRLLVGTLGESSRFGWWRTSFFDPTSQAFLTPIFAKTSALACYHGVVEAARRVHDESLSVGSFHLFRFREELEQDLHALMRGSDGSDILGGLPRDRDQALAALNSMSGGTVKSVPGPVSLGTKVEIESSEFIGTVASIYAAAFSSGTRSFPYFVSQA